MIVSVMHTCMVLVGQPSIVCTIGGSLQTYKTHDLMVIYAQLISYPFDKKVYSFDTHPAHNRMTQSI